MRFLCLVGVHRPTVAPQLPSTRTSALVITRIVCAHCAVPLGRTGQ